MKILDWLRRRRRRPRVVAAPPAMFPGPADLAGFAVVDLEMSGFSPARHEIVEVAVVQTDRGGRVIDEWHTLVKPYGSVGPTHVHGIRRSVLLGAPRFAQVVGELNARLAGRALVAHNARFDLLFLAGPRRLGYMR